MKKHIEVVKVNKNILTKIIAFLKGESELVEEYLGGELVEGLTELKEGNTNSLLLEGELGANAFDPYKGLEFGNLKIQAISRKVTENNRDINLTPKEFDILYFLASNSGQVFTKEQIYQEVWATSYCLDDSNIMAFIRKLRKKIEPNPDSPIYILTVWGIGYKFNDNL